MRSSRTWLVLVLALFCVPLFVGLGRADIEHDEAIYAFGVDRILEIGDWLAPRSSPDEDAPFLEKPPLKFWIVAAPMRLGLLPHNEFGMRFWDATFGGLAFLYVFAIGRVLAGPLAGAVAVLVLFVHWPLIFEHGIRTNNMESPLLLAYAAGVFHFMRWADGSSDRTAPWHARAVGLAFALGFLTKFVAAVFLPVVLGLTALTFGETRRRLLVEWRTWVATAGLVALLSAPWFVYASVRFGPLLWETILKEHVYNRFTASLDPSHLQPWHFYLTTLYDELVYSGAAGVAMVGVLLLAVQTVRLQWRNGFLVLAWLVVPLAIITAGTSKLYHYTYPFLPPVGLGVGYLVAKSTTLLGLLANAVLRRVDWEWIAPRTALVRWLDRRFARLTLLALASAALALATATLLLGQIRIQVDSTVIVRSSGVVRPVLVGLCLGVLAGARRGVSPIAALLLVSSVLPIPAYRAIWRELTTDVRPMAAATDCLRRVASGQGSTSPGLYVDVPPAVMTHGMNYYFRRIRPWTRTTAPAPEALEARLAAPSPTQPMLVHDETYQTYMRGGQSGARQRVVSPPLLSFPDVVLLLPGPYSACAGLSTARPPRRPGPTRR